MLTNLTMFSHTMCIHQISVCESTVFIEGNVVPGKSFLGFPLLMTSLDVNNWPEYLHFSNYLEQELYEKLAEEFTAGSTVKPTPLTSPPSPHQRSSNLFFPKWIKARRPEEEDKILPSGYQQVSGNSVIKNLLQWNLYPKNNIGVMADLVPLNLCLHIIFNSMTIVRCSKINA